MQSRLKSFAFAGSMVTVVGMVLALPLANAQGPGRITPAATISTTHLPTDQVTDILVRWYNINDNSSRPLNPNDAFGVTFGNTCGPFTFETNALTDSTNFAPEDFVVAAGGPGQLTVTYSSTPTDFGFGESLSVLIHLTTPANAGSCAVAYNVPENGNYDELESPLEILSFADSPAAAGIPTGAVILSLDTCADGYTQVTDYNGMFLRGGTTAGQQGGANTHAHSGTGLNIPAQNVQLQIGGANDQRLVDDNSGGDNHFVSGSNHTHSGIAALPDINIAGNTSAASNVPEFRTIVLCERN